MEGGKSKEGKEKKRNEYEIVIYQHYITCSPLLQSKKKIRIFIGEIKSIKIKEIISIDHHHYHHHQGKEVLHTTAPSSSPSTLPVIQGNIPVSISSGSTPLEGGCESPRSMDMLAGCATQGLSGIGGSGNEGKRRGGNTQGGVGRREWNVEIEDKYGKIYKLMFKDKWQSFHFLLIIDGWRRFYYQKSIPSTIKNSILNELYSTSPPFSDGSFFGFNSNYSPWHFNSLNTPNFFLICSSSSSVTFFWDGKQFRFFLFLLFFLVLFSFFSLLIFPFPFSAYLPFPLLCLFPLSPRCLFTLSPSPCLFTISPSPCLFPLSPSPCLFPLSPSPCLFPLSPSLPISPFPSLLIYPFPLSSYLPFPPPFLHC